MTSKKELLEWGETDTPARRDAWELLLLEIDARVSLTKTQYEGLRSRYESVTRILENPGDPALGDLLIFPQGSFATLTVTRPPGRSDVDVDAIAYVIGGTQLAPVELLDRLFDELDARARTEGSVKPSKRCVTINYADQQVPCHMDVTPAVNQPGNVGDDGTGRLWVPDRPTAWWSPSNPKDFAAWFDERAALEFSVLLPTGYRALLEKRAEPLPDHEEIVAPNGLRVAVRLMKRHRDVYAKRTNRKKTQPISVLLTTLAANAYERVVRRFHGQSLTPLKILMEIVAEMPRCFDAPTATEQYRVLNPRDPNENFAEKWNDNPLLARTFFDWHAALEQTLRCGLVNFPSRERFRSELTDAFGTSAGRACDEYLAEIRTGGEYPGLSEAAARQARIAGQSAALIGLGRTEPTRAAEPDPLDRLG